MGQAMAQVVAMSDRAMSWMPKGTLPPMIMRMDAGSVPVGYLVLESKEASLGQLGDSAQNLVRPQVQKNVPGTVAVSPFGPNMRSIVIRVDPQKLRDYNLTPQDVVDALAKGNTIVPAGNVYIKDSMPIVANNATVVDVQRLGTIPLKLGQNVYLRDVATIQDDTDITYGYALVNGKKSVYLPIIKKATGSTLTVVADTRKSMKLFRGVIPKESGQGQDQLRVRRVAHGAGGGRERGHRRADRRGLDRTDDPPVPPRPEERDRRRGHHPARPARIVGRALADGQHDQHHVAGRHGAVDRHPRRHVDGDHRERARADGSHAEDRHGRAAREQRHGRADPAGAAVHPVAYSCRRSS